MLKIVSDSETILRRR